MSKSVSKLSDPKSSIPRHIRELLGKPPILGNENPRQYYVLMTELARDVNPVNIIDWLWIQDVTALTSDILRYRRGRALARRNRALRLL